MNSAYFSLQLSPICLQRWCSSETYKMSSWINTWVWFILSLSDECFTYLAAYIQSFQVSLLERISLFKGTWQTTISLTDSLHKSLCWNQTTSREGTQPEIASKGWAYQCSPPIWECLVSEGDRPPALELRALSTTRGIYSNFWTTSKWDKGYLIVIWRIRS